MTLQNFQELDIAGDFKLDDVLSDNQEDEVKSNNFGNAKTNDTKKMYNNINNYEAKKILKIKVQKLKKH